MNSKAFADTMPSLPPPPVAENVAVSLLAGFDCIKDVVSQAGAPRRPNRAIPINNDEAIACELLQRITPSNSTLLKWADALRPSSEWLSSEEEDRPW